MADLKVCVVGASGYMGLELIKASAARDGVVLVAAVERSGSDAIGKDATALAGLAPQGVMITDDAAAAIGGADAILDFTAPVASVGYAQIAALSDTMHVIGTTGCTPEQDAEISEAARRVAIVKAGNMSLGVNLITALTKRMAMALDEEYDVEVLEMHHRRKVDAPSGTALMLGEAAAAGRNVELAARSVRSRDGQTGARQRGDIGFATLRGGSVVGEHEVIFASDSERVSIKHIASDRGVFARGAVAAALWAKGRPPGLYSMLDVLGLNDA